MKSEGLTEVGKRKFKVSNTPLTPFPVNVNVCGCVSMSVCVCRPDGSWFEDPDGNQEGKITLHETHWLTTTGHKKDKRNCKCVHVIWHPIYIWDSLKLTHTPTHTPTHT